MFLPVSILPGSPCKRFCERHFCHRGGSQARENGGYRGENFSRFARKTVYGRQMLRQNTDVYERHPSCIPWSKKKCYHTSHMESARRMRIKRTRRTEQPYHVFPCWKKRGMIFPHFQKIRKYLLQKKWLTIISVHVRNTYVKVDKKLIGVRNRGLSGWTLPLTK